MMVNHGARPKKIRRAALLLAALSLLVVAVSAYMRLDGAGLGCADWPACYGQLLAREPGAPQFSIVRLMHRITASSALVLACFLVWICLRPQPVRPAAGYATLLLLLMLALSALGIWSSDPRLPLVGFMNIVGGFALLGLSWRVVLATGVAPSRETWKPRGFLLLLGVAALVATVLLGAWIGASYAAVACPSVPHCGGIWLPPDEGWAALDTPFVRLVKAALPGDAGGVTLNLLHRYSAAGAVLLLGAGGVRALARDTTRGAARVVLLLLVVELGLGGLTVASGFGLGLAVAHCVGAAALLASVVTLLRR
ncbi:MAG: COX15/CtaA family protein [Betaproteobacteria bacterium]|nr:COX15/CtaA family protein [Betaproteobacteria bacterium]